MAHIADNVAMGPVRVTLLRRQGRKLKMAQVQAEQQYCGSINSHWLRTTSIVTMRTGLADDAQKRLPPDLYNPVFSSVGNHRLRLYGIESIDGAAYAQEWMIDFLQSASI